MTRRNPPPGQIAQIQVPGVSAQPLGGVRPASPPPPDLSRLQRFRGLSQSVERFLGASADNDRLLSGQEAALAFEGLTDEQRAQLNSPDPEVRKSVLDAHFDKLADDGLIARADHPRFIAAFRKQAARAEINDYRERAINRLPELASIYDQDGSLQPTITPEQLLAEEREALEETFAFQDPFARRQVAEELLQVEQELSARASAVQAQAFEEASRDQAKNQVFNLVSDAVAEALGGGVPIEDADLSAVARVAKELRDEVGQKDARHIVVDAFGAAIGQLRANDRFNEALAVLQRLETLRDDNRNPMVRDADTAARVADLREALEREEEQQNDRDIRTDALERQEDLQRGQGEILRHIFVGQEQGATLEQIRESRYDMVLRNYPENLQGELLSFMETELRRAEDRSLTSEAGTLQRLRRMAIDGELTPEAVLEAGDALSWNDTKELLQAADDQASVRNSYPAEVRQLVEETPSFFSVPGAPYSEQSRLLGVGSQRLGELHRRLLASWNSTEGEPDIKRRQALRDIGFEFENENREILDAEREKYQARVSSVESELTQRGLALTDTEVLQYADTLPQEILDKWVDRATNVSARVADQRSKAEGASIGRASRLVDQYILRNPDLADHAAEVMETFTQQIYEEFDRFEREDLPNLRGSQVFSGYRNAAREIIQNTIIPQVSPLLDTVQERVQGGQSREEALQRTADEFQRPFATDLERFPELRKWAGVDPDDTEARFKAASKAILGAPPERQADLFIEAATHMGIKAEEVLQGRARLITRRTVPMGRGGRGVDLERHLPIDFLAQSRAKYLIPLFESEEEFSTFIDRQEDMERLMDRLDIPESDWPTWVQIQKERIQLIHGQ